MSLTSRDSLIQQWADFRDRIYRSAGKALILFAIAQQAVYYVVASEPNPANSAPCLMWTAFVAILTLLHPTAAASRYFMAGTLLVKSMVFSDCLAGSESLTALGAVDPHTLGILALLCLYRDTQLSLILGALVFLKGLSGFHCSDFGFHSEVSPRILASSAALLVTGTSFLSNAQSIREVERTAYSVEQQKEEAARTFHRQSVNRELHATELTILKERVREMALAFEVDVLRLRQAGDSRVQNNEAIAVPLDRLATNLIQLHGFISRIRDVTRVAKALSAELNQSAQKLQLLIRSVIDLQEQLGDFGRRFLEQFRDSAVQVERIEPLLGQLRDLARESKILSINISVESELAGDMGRGFRVLARELRGLTNTTDGQIAALLHVLDEIRHSVGKGSESIGEVSNCLKDCDATFEGLQLQSQSTINETMKVCQMLDNLEARLVRQEQLVKELAALGTQVSRHNQQQSNLSSYLKSHLETWQQIQLRSVVGDTR